MSLDEKLKLVSFNEVKVIEFFKFIHKALSALKPSIKIEYLDPTMINMDNDGYIFARLKCDTLNRNPDFEAPEFLGSELKPYFCASLIAFKIFGKTLGKWSFLNLIIANQIKVEKYKNLKTFLVNLISAPNEFRLSDFENLIA